MMDNNYMRQVEIFEIRSEDTETYRQLRLEMIRQFPLSYGVDLDELEQRSFEWFENDVSKILHNPDANRFFARAGELMVGMVGVIVYRNNYTVSEIGSMYVRENFHGHGVGGRLLERAVDFSKQRGALSTSLWVHENNRAAIQFYETHGFHVCDPVVIKKRFDDNGVEFKMDKVIVE